MIGSEVDNSLTLGRIYDIEGRSRDFCEVLSCDWTTDPPRSGRSQSPPTARQTIHRLDLDASFKAMILRDCAAHL